MNRGIARRTLFERGDDMRYFLAALARAARAGEIEIHSYCLMTTHYHLLLRSPLGRLSRAMHKIQLAYSRSFNRGRNRDGPLVRGRFRSRLVEPLAYRLALVSYIDWNPVEAGLVPSPERYPYGSAYHYLRQAGPKWLERGWIEEAVATAAADAGSYQPARYLEVFGHEKLAPLRRVVAERIVRPRSADPLDDMIRAAPREMVMWLCERAQLADGTRPGLPVADVAVVESVVSRAARKREWVLPHSRSRNAWNLVRVALSYELCSLSQGAIAARAGCSASQVSTLIREHRQRIKTDPEYAARVGGLASEALEAWRRLLK